MNYFIYFVITIVTLSAQTPFVPQKTFTFTHSNDLNILGDTSGIGRGDDLLTGVLGLEYVDDTSTYVVNMKAYTQKYIAHAKRIDTIELGYLKEIISDTYHNYDYDLIFGSQIISSGNFYGASLQNLIHKVTKNPELNIPYSNDRSVTFGVSGRVFVSYVWSKDTSFYSDFSVQVNIDKSGYARVETGIKKKYKYASFKIATVLHEIQPFDNSIVIASTPDRYSAYFLFGASVQFSKSFEILLDTTAGGAPLGEKDDYCTTIRLRYFFD